MKNNDDHKVLEIIKRTILEEARQLGIDVERIVLFGSRARGDFREDSDYDVLVVVKDTVDHSRLKALQLKSYRRLSRLGLYCDIIVVTETYYNRFSMVVGNIAYYAAREGVEI